MGIRLNQSGDAMDFEPYLDKMINQVLLETRSLDYVLGDLSNGLRRQLSSELDCALARYRRDQPIGGRWGWKNPRSMYLLPIIYARFPEMWFVHVIRDGRDMALSENRNQLRKHYQALFGETPAEADNWAALRLWAETNLAAAHWGERTLKTRYVRLRFEDLCSNPVTGCAALAHRLELPITEGELLASSIVSPATLGRWQDTAPPPTIDTLASAALAVFGYR
jgi:hypothetical protein